MPNVKSIEIKTSKGLYTVTTIVDDGEIKQDRFDLTELGYWLDELQENGTGEGIFQVGVDSDNNIMFTKEPTFEVSIFLPIDSLPMSADNNLNGTNILNKSESTLVLLPGETTTRATFSLAKNGAIFTDDYSLALTVKSGFSASNLGILGNDANFWFVQTDIDTGGINSVIQINPAVGP